MCKSSQLHKYSFSLYQKVWDCLKMVWFVEKAGGDTSCVLLTADLLNNAIHGTSHTKCYVCYVCYGVLFLPVLLLLFCLQEYKIYCVHSLNNLKIQNNKKTTNVFFIQFCFTCKHFNLENKFKLDISFRTEIFYFIYWGSHRN